VKQAACHNTPKGSIFAKCEVAVEAARRVDCSYPGYPRSYSWLAAVLGQLGRTEEATGVLEKPIARAPMIFDSYVNQILWMRPEDHAHLLDGLRKAG